MMTTAPPCRNQCFRQTGPVISEITGLDSAAAVWLVIVSDLSYISSDHYTLLDEYSQMRVKKINTFPSFIPLFYCNSNFAFSSDCMLVPRVFFLVKVCTTFVLVIAVDQFELFRFEYM